MIIIALLLVEIVFLIEENQKLRSYFDDQPPQYVGEPLQNGEKVIDFRYETLNNEEAVFHYNNSNDRYLFFIFSVRCPHCLNNLTNWKTISSSRLSTEVSIIGVSLDPVEYTVKYIIEHNIPFYSISVAADTSFRKVYKIAGVPETILINGNGTVEKVWMGELTQEQVKENIAVLSDTFSLNNQQNSQQP